MAAPTQNISGLISGLDWNDTIDALMDIERSYANSLQDRITDDNNKLTAWGSVTARLLTLKNYGAVLNREATFQDTTATSSTIKLLAPPDVSVSFIASPALLS